MLFFYFLILFRGIRYSVEYFSMIIVVDFLKIIDSARNIRYRGYLKGFVVVNVVMIMRVGNGENDNFRLI